MYLKKAIIPLFFFFLSTGFILFSINAQPVTIEYFYEQDCPSCIVADRFIIEVENYYEENITIIRYDVLKNDSNFNLFKKYGFLTTPAVVVNYSIILPTNILTRYNLQQAINTSLHGGEEITPDYCNITTIFGTINICEHSLPVLTVILGAIDSFNPCAFFILIFLLNLLVYIESKKRMFIIGGIFIFISGLVYLLMMVLLFQASTQLYALIDQNVIISILIGCITLSLGLFMIKDFFFFKQGPSLSISEEKKKHLFKRMRAIVHASRFSSMIVGTIILAILANTYELICTLAIPFSYVGTLHSVYNITDLHSAAPYLIFYNIVYVIPLFIIVAAFTWKFDKKKLSEWQGRILKLFSGMMMILLGITFLLFPNALKNSISILGIIIIAILVTIFIQYITKKIIKRKKRLEL